MKQLNWMVVHALLNIGFFPKKKKKFHSGTGCSSKETVDCPATTDFLPRSSVAHCVVQIMYVRTMITTIVTPTANTDFLLLLIRR